MASIDLKKPEDYKGKSTIYPMPQNEVDPKVKKEKDYHYAVVNSMLAFWVDGKFVYNYGQQRTIQELWDYAQGRQNMDKIKKLVTRKTNKATGRPLTKMNISWEGYAKLPQLFDVMRSKNMSQEYDPDLYCVDNDSIAEREKSKNVLKYILDENTKAFVARAQMKPNFQIDPEQIGVQTQDEVDMYFDSGAFTLEWERAAIAALQKSKTDGNYKEFQDRSFDNLIINPNGFCGGRTYTDKNDGIPKVRSIDIKNALCPWFEGFDSKGKIMRAGEVIEMTIGDIAKANPSLSPAELKFIAKQYVWMNKDYENKLEGRNFYGPNNLSSMVNTSVGTDPIHNVRVLVLDYQFISEDTETFLYNIGRKLFKEVDYGYKLTRKAENNGDRVRTTTRFKKYEGMWIVGTKHFLSFGESQDVSYSGTDGNLVPDLDFHFVKTGNLSLIERAISIVDDMNMALMKERNIWATLPAAPAMAISKRMVENVFMNGKKIEPHELITDFIEGGILYYDGFDEFDKPIYGVNGNKPIDFINLQNIINLLSTCSAQMAIKVNELKELMGLQGGVDGGSMDRYQGLGQTQLAFEAANSSLAPTFNAYKYLFKNVMSALIKKWQIKARKQKDLKIPYRGLGARSMKMLEISHPFTVSDFNIEVTIQPTVEERQMLLADLRNLRGASISSGGQVGLSASEYMFAYEKVMAGNIKECMYLLGKIEAKKAQAIRQRQMQDQEYNIQSNRAAGEAKTQGDLAIQDLKNQGASNVAVIKSLSEQIKELSKLILSSKKEGDRNDNEDLAIAAMAEKQSDFDYAASQGVPQPQAPQAGPNQLAMSNEMANMGQGAI